ncbi:MAG TPA: hypothetical protein VEK08_15325 [Planctomycetota bacterium]|nr:hypothetical protein [Planctomycetota bacterium]
MQRRWLQLHLSTLLALVFIAAGLLWLNCSATMECVVGYELVNDRYEPVTRAVPVIGWPVSCNAVQILYLEDNGVNLPVESPSLQFWPLFTDGLVALGVLLPAAAILESITRRFSDRSLIRLKAAGNAEAA